MTKKDRPLTATLPNGTILTVADLPPPSTRWVASRKEIVVNAVAYDLISREEALRRYGLSEEEFESWCRALIDHGPTALKVTLLQRYRK
ncbi:CtrA inhibitor SciP [Paracoccus methylarcula]|uniref:DUF1153 domain-containing protein n=1 Tax=Paracoccus methylarcula TaxID=72022 RepID=A0A3R7Q202_9RHOB|nr:DUF1153 domain-containing protein [Paracoccus methylarcula]RNF34059.1 DUF1153 domain-containing protein [Paracoccus methylarcula]